MKILALRSYYLRGRSIRIRMQELKIPILILRIITTTIDTTKENISQMEKICYNDPSQDKAATG
jgi:hypothetical protein